MVEIPPEGPEELLLFGMARLTCLTRLNVRADNVDWPPAGSAYSTLSASSTLVHLELVDVFFPSGAWRHVFVAPHTLPYLM